MTKWSPEHHRRRARRRCVRASFVQCVAGQKGANGEGEEVARLTGVAASTGASSGVVGAEQNGEGDLRGRSWGRRGRGRLQGGRALGARPVRSSRGRRRRGTTRRSSGTTVDVVSTTVRSRRRRPWRGESGGEELGGGGGVWGVEGDVDVRSMPPERRGGEAGRRAAAWRAVRSPSSTCLPAWPSQAARWSGSWAGPAGGPGGRQVSVLSLSLFYFLFCFISFATLFI